jgi:hypothetical protein
VPADLSTQASIAIAAVLLLLAVVGFVIVGFQRGRIRRLLDDRERCILALMVCQARSAPDRQFYLDGIWGVPPLNPRLRQFVKRRLDEMVRRKLVDVAQIKVQETAQGNRRTDKRLRYQFTEAGQRWISHMGARDVR